MLSKFGNVPFAMLHRRGFRFDPDPTKTGDAGGNAGGGGDGGKKEGDTGGNAGGDPDLIPRGEARQAFQARDKAKKQLQATISGFAETFGLDADQITLEANDGDDKAERPFKLVAPGLDDLAKIVKDHKKNAGKNKTRDEIESEIRTNYENRRTKETNKATARQNRRDAYIQQVAADEPLRAACAAEGAIDDDNGKFSDLVTLLKPRVRVEIQDEENDDDPAGGSIKVRTIVLNADGTAMKSKDNAAAGVRDLVREYLDAHPKYRKSGHRTGAGAGGRVNGDGGQSTGVKTSNNGDGRTNAAGFMFAGPR